MTEQIGSSALQHILNRPHRRGRPESMLRRLTNTSYPHNAFANLVIDLSKQVGHEGTSDLQQTAESLYEIENNLDMFHFFRCIEIERNTEGLTVTAKTLKLESGMRSIRDTMNNHEILARCHIHAEADTQLTAPSEIAAYLMHLYYRSHMNNKAWGDLIKQSKWVIRNNILSTRKREELGPTAAHADDTQIGYLGAMEAITRSLGKPTFHVVLAQHTLMLLDQRARLWCLDKVGQD